MFILRQFYNMSGLKVNEDLWVGAMKKITCKEYNLDWDQKPLKILGVTFTAE